MLKTIKLFADIAFSIIAITPQRKKIEKMKKENSPQKDIYANEFIRKWANRRIKSNNISLEVIGKENIPKDRPVLFIANHQSNLDFIAVLAEVDVPFSFIAKIELEKVPVMNKWMRTVDALFIDRQNMRQQIQVILDGIQMLKGGRSIFVFPEGTRTRDGKMLEFKAGTFKLATKSGVDIIPVTIDGTYKMLEGNGNRFKPGKVKLYFHEAVRLDSLTKEELSDINNYVKNIVKSPLEE